MKQRPKTLLFSTGTGTGVGKTWLSVEILGRLRESGYSVSARKPVQSLEPTDELPDATLLAQSTGESPNRVCLESRTYRLAMAPPIASSVLGQEEYTVANLAEEIKWGEAIDFGLIEGAGGLCSPIAHDGDSRDLIALTRPDWILLVTDAGLGVIHQVTSSVAALMARLADDLCPKICIYLNRFDAASRTHIENLAWLSANQSSSLAISTQDVLELVASA
ncbi:MAG TPA: dethiobiotin synthase [Acidimicrobiales bacterium]|nr:dethiobiotin synthase [Acidimicrobiales bacterium]